MTRDEFESLTVGVIKVVQDELMAEYDRLTTANRLLLKTGDKMAAELDRLEIKTTRLTALNAQLLEALIDFMRMVEEHSTPIILAHATIWGKAHAAIRAAEGKIINGN